MVTDQDIERLKAVFATTEEVAALRTSLTDLLATLVHHERQVAGSDHEGTELVRTLSPTGTISQAFDSAALQADLERSALAGPELAHEVCRETGAVPLDRLV
jgi:hypothetical protein